MRVQSRGRPSCNEETRARVCGNFRGLSFKFYDENGLRTEYTVVIVFTLEEVPTVLAVRPIRLLDVDHISECVGGSG